MEGIPSQCHVYPILCLAHFTEKNMGISQHGNGFLKGSNQKSKHSKVLGRLCKVCMVKCIQKQIRACPLCCVYKSGLQSQLTPKGIGSRLDLVTRAATCCPGTAGTHGMFLWRPSTNHVTLSSFPLLSYCLYFVTKIALLQVI